MHEAFGNPFSGADLVLPPARYQAFRIGPLSDFDMVRVNGALLRAGDLLVLKTDGASPKLTYERGPQSRPSTAMPTAAYVAHVIGYECGDPMPPPGPRASRIYREHMTLDAATPTVRRVPFSGRRHGHIRIAFAEQGLTFYVQGIRWSDADTVKRFATETLFGGNLVGTSAAQIAVAATADDANNTGVHVGTGQHTGGTNDAEYWDELAVILTCANGGGVVLEVETAGEEGVA